MRVGVLTFRDLGIVGGSLVRIVGITRALGELGCAVTLLAPTMTPELEGKVRFVPLPSHCRSSRLALLSAAFPDLGRPLRYLPGNLALARLIRRQGIDLVHCHQHDAGFAMVPHRPLLDVPIAFELHGILRLQQDDLRAAAPFPGYVPLALRAEHHLFQRIDAIFVRTQVEGRYLASEFDGVRDKTYVVPDGADVDFLGQPVSGAAIQEARTRLGLGDRKVILFAGWFKLPSGVLDLVRAFQRLCARRGDVSLILAGDGVLMPQVKGLVEDERLTSVVLPGLVSREELRVYQQLAEVVVTPEIKSEFNELGAPLKLFECLASGRPTVATRIASHTAIVEDEVNGFLAAPDDPADLARTLERALTHAEAHRIGQRGRETMVAKHSWRQSSHELVRAYREVLARAGEGRGVQVSG